MFVCPDQAEIWAFLCNLFCCPCLRDNRPTASSPWHHCSPPIDLPGVFVLPPKALHFTETSRDLFFWESTRESTKHQDR